MNIFLSPFAPENLVSQDGFRSPVPRQPAHLHTPAESGIKDSVAIAIRSLKDRFVTIVSLTLVLI